MWYFKSLYGTFYMLTIQTIHPPSIPLLTSWLTQMAVMECTQWYYRFHPMKRGKERGKQRNEEKCRGVEPRIRGPCRKDPPWGVRLGSSATNYLNMVVKRPWKKRFWWKLQKVIITLKEKGGKFRGSAVQTQCHKPVHNFTDYRG